MVEPSGDSPDQVDRPNEERSLGLEGIPAEEGGGHSPLDSFVAEVDEAHAGVRLDVFWARRLPGFSRAQITRSVEAGRALVDGKSRKASFRLSPGAKLLLELRSEAKGPLPEQIPLDILYEDEALAVINKPTGMVVHPAKGHWHGTLASALQGHFDQLSGAAGVTRPGIVHRLDRDTSGVIVVARTDAAHHALADQFQARTVRKEYLAITAGVPDRDRDRIVHPIGPHPVYREQKALRADHPDSREAETFYEVRERFRGFALVSAQPKTGRTHQIRLHLMHIGCPVLCDRLYGGRSQISVAELRQITRARPGPPVAGEPQFLAEEVLLARQALHAHRLCFSHPLSGVPLEFEAPLPADFSRTLLALRELGRIR